MFGPWKWITIILTVYGITPLNKTGNHSRVLSASEQLINFLLLYYRLSENHLLISPYPASSIHEATHTQRERNLGSH